MESNIIRILHLEDKASDARLVQRTLEREGMAITVTVARSEQEFKQAFEQGEYDIILGDYRLPGWNGIDALRWSRSMHLDVPFILVTATLGDEQAAVCIKEGAADYVLKDRLERLPVAIKNAVEENRLRVERDAAQKKLRDAAQQYRLLFEANPTPMWVARIDDKSILAVNDAIVEHYGYTQEEFLRMSILDVLPPEDVPVLLARYENQFEPQVRHVGIRRHRKKNGTPMLVDVTIRDIIFQDIEARIALLRDVTAQLHAEEQHRSIIHGAPFGIYRVKADGTLLLANPALVTMLGYESEEEILKLNSADFYENPDDRQKLLNLAQVPGVVSHEMEWKRKDHATLQVRMVGRRLKIENGDDATYEVFVEDITERRSLEAQFLQAQKMEAVGQLAGGIAHDFNNLLMVIRGNAQILKELRNDPAKVDHHSLQIVKAADKAASVARQLLVFSRKQTLTREPMDLNATIADLWKMLPRLLGEDIEMHTDLDPELGVVCADQGQMEQIVMNLAVNARDAMPKGGKLTIETANVHFETTAIWGAGQIRPGEYVVLAVKDTGSGMSPETQARIFEPFFTTKERGKGTGLGLATVYGIVKQSNGFIRVDSEAGRGTTFFIYLPLAKDAAIASAAPAQEVATAGSETILVVEDDEMLRELMTEYLSSKGYKVMLATSGIEALAVFKSGIASIDLLMTDVVLPGMGGQELAAALRELEPEMQIIFVSGYTDRELDDTILGEHSRFLHKPFSLNNLAQHVREVLDRKAKTA